MARETIMQRIKNFLQPDQERREQQFQEADHRDYLAGAEQSAREDAAGWMQDMSKVDQNRLAIALEARGLTPDLEERTSEAWRDSDKAIGWIDADAKALASQQFRDFDNQTDRIVAYQEVAKVYESASQELEAEDFLHRHKDFPAFPETVELDPQDGRYDLAPGVSFDDAAKEIATIRDTLGDGTVRSVGDSYPEIPDAYAENWIKKATQISADFAMLEKEHSEELAVQDFVSRNPDFPAYPKTVELDHESGYYELTPGTDQDQYKREVESIRAEFGDEGGVEGVIARHPDIPPEFAEAWTSMAEEILQQHDWAEAQNAETVELSYAGRWKSVDASEERRQVVVHDDDGHHPGYEVSVMGGEGPIYQSEHAFPSAGEASAYLAIYEEDGDEHVASRRAVVETLAAMAEKIERAEPVTFASEEQAKQFGDDFKAEFPHRELEHMAEGAPNALSAHFPDRAQQLAVVRAVVDAQERQPSIGIDTKAPALETDVLVAEQKAAAHEHGEDFGV